LFVQTKEFASIIRQSLGRILFERGGGGEEEEEEEKGGACSWTLQFWFFQKGIILFGFCELGGFFFLGRADFKRRVRERASERASETDRQRECARAAKERDKSDGDHQRVHGWEVAEGVRRE
jgi:hypothetical protein